MVVPFQVVDDSRTSPAGGPLIFMMGPTASGKSGIALHLARSLPLEIINCDALQVYRGLEIGTAKPSLEERSLVPHHLFDISEPDEPFSVGRYLREVLPVIARCHARDRVPLLVGGSGLYFRAVERGLAPVPEIAEELRARVASEGEALGWPALHRELRRVDPEAAERITPHDSQRIARAIAVARATGRPLSEWQRLAAPAGEFRILKLVPEWPRAELYRRIEERFDRMLEQGILEEARELLSRGYSGELPAMKALGYRPLFGWIRGELSRERAVELARQESRRYAKRQLTWLRQEAGVHWLPPPHQAERAVALVTEFLKLARGGE